MTKQMKNIKHFYVCNNSIQFALYLAKLSESTADKDREYILARENANKVFNKSQLLSFCFEGNNIVLLKEK